MYSVAKDARFMRNVGLALIAMTACNMARCIGQIGWEWQLSFFSGNFDTDCFL